MPTFIKPLAIAAAALAIGATALADDHGKRNGHKQHGAHKPGSVQLGPRPFFLVDDMSDGPLKRQLQQCAQRGAFTARDFSIGHRGAAMQFPEHTAESYVAAARMGAGIVECAAESAQPHARKQSAVLLPTMGDDIISPSVADSCISSGRRPARAAASKLGAISTPSVSAPSFASGTRCCADLKAQHQAGTRGTRKREHDKPASMPLETSQLREMSKRRSSSVVAILTAMQSEQQKLEAAIASLEAQRWLLGDAVANAALGPLRAKLAALAWDPEANVDQALKQ